MGKSHNTWRHDGRGNNKRNGSKRDGNDRSDRCEDFESSRGSSNSRDADSERRKFGGNIEFDDHRGQDEGRVRPPREYRDSERVYDSRERERERERERDRQRQLDRERDRELQCERERDSGRSRTSNDQRSNKQSRHDIDRPTRLYDEGDRNGNRPDERNNVKRNRSRSPLPPPPPSAPSAMSRGGWPNKPPPIGPINYHPQDRKRHKFSNGSVNNNSTTRTANDFAGRLSSGKDQENLPNKRGKIQISLGRQKKRRSSKSSVSEELSRTKGWTDAGCRQDKKQPHKDIEPITMRNSSVYDRILQVGEGTYGKVYKSRNVDTGDMAALKRLRMESERDGMPITAIREIKLLQSLRHRNIVSLREMMIEEGNIYMTFEYMDHDLAGILAHPQLRLNDSQIKFLLQQMLDGLAYIHHKGILHRDIKGSNILLDRRGNLKLADFGLARTIDLSNPKAHYTNRVITLWYRPPELLLGATIYSTAIDVWGIGCLLVEMYTRAAIFAGQDEISQIQTIYDIMGTPTSETWPDIHQLPWYSLLKPQFAKRNQFNEKYSRVMTTVGVLDLATRLLEMNPEKRLSAEGALNHVYFQQGPAPTPLDLGNIGEWHEFEAKRRRRKERETKKQLEQQQEYQQQQQREQ